MPLKAESVGTEVQPFYSSFIIFITSYKPSLPQHIRISTQLVKCSFVLWVGKEEYMKYNVSVFVVSTLIILQHHKCRKKKDQRQPQKCQRIYTAAYSSFKPKYSLFNLNVSSFIIHCKTKFLRSLKKFGELHNCTQADVF